jgi:acyl dehydratase
VAARNFVDPKEKFFEDFELGDTMTTRGRTVDIGDITNFAGLTGDHYQLHTDAAFMQASRFGQRIAHGTMTFAIGIGLTATQINPRAMTYGYERLRFPAPVFAGDTIRTTVTIGRKADDPKRPGHGQVVEICETVNQHGKTVMYCEHILLVERRPA